MDWIIFVAWITFELNWDTLKKTNVLILKKKIMNKKSELYLS